MEDYNKKNIIKNTIKSNIKKMYCSNCGKHGHNYNKCNEPISSFGIIAIQVDDEFYKNIKKNSSINNLNISKLNTINNNIFLKTHKYKEKIKFMMICRRKSLGYLEFIRGRYSINDTNHIISLFEQMTREEVMNLQSSNFDTLWKDLWHQKINNKFFLLEYDKSKVKFNILKNRKTKDINYFANSSIQKFNNPEWGFPKGRRNFLEKDLSCAIREFKEETALNSDEFLLFPGIKPLEEIFNGTNKILYRHVYFIAFCKKSTPAKLSNAQQMEEIGDIGWFNYNECMKLFRSFHKKRKYILNDIYMFICNILENNIDLNNYRNNEFNT